MRKLILLFVIAGTSANAQYIAEFLPTPNGTGRAGGAGAGQIVGIAFGSGGGPALWDGPNHTYSVLNTTGYTGAEVLGTGGGQQVGYGNSGSIKALMWSTLGAAPISLHPAAYLGSIAYNTDGTTQGGAVAPNQTVSNAAMWQGTAASVVVLHPAGFENSEVRGVWGDIQVGGAAGGPGGAGGAVLWRGTMESMQILPLPPGHLSSGAMAVHGDQIVGSAADAIGNDGQHAMLWLTDGKSVTNLSPTGWGSFAMDTNGQQQVGVAAQVSGEERAVVWSGTAQSMLNLHQFLPSNIAYSLATGIDEDGNIVGWGHINGGVGQVPIVWAPVPEPATFLAIGIGLLALSWRSRAKR